MIAFRTVSYAPSGSDKRILHDVSFTVGKGEFAVISGETGSGKSTILKLLTAECKAISGEILVGETSVSSLKKSHIPEYRRSIGCVFQSIALLQEKTVAENIAFALEVQRSDSRAEITKKVEARLDEVGLSNKAHVYPKALSLGEQQRVSIARALITEPLLLIADEPAAQLDDVSAESIFSILRDEHIRGMTILITASTDRFFPLLPKFVSHYHITMGKVDSFLPESLRSLPT